jgi:hypothetical protein
MASHDPVVRHNEALDLEKRQVSLKENIDGSQDGSGYECEFSLREQKKIIHRIDRRLVVTVGVLYCISLMDRTNLSAAAIAGYVDETPMNVHIRANQFQHDGGIEVESAGGFDIALLNRHYRLLRVLHCLSTSCDGDLSLPGTTKLPSCNRTTMGRCNDRHGLLRQLRNSSGAQSRPWYIGSGILPKLRLFVVNLVYVCRYFEVKEYTDSSHRHAI